ncbi:hypothetical protein Hanom_Chr05g00472951 [Helianthus anomalus]
MQFSDGEEKEDTQASVGDGEAEQSPVEKVSSPHAAGSKVHGENEGDVGGNYEERDSRPFDVFGCQLRSVGVGPEVAGFQEWIR